MSSNEKVFIAITFHIFNKYTFGWLWSVHDCYVPQSRSIDEPFESFCTTNIMEVVKDSDEKAFLGALNAFNKKENDFDEETHSNVVYMEPENRKVCFFIEATGPCEERVTRFWMAFNI